MSDEIINVEFCRGCIYFNPAGRKQQKKCSRFSGPKIGIDKNGKKHCIVKDALTLKNVICEIFFI